MFDMLVKLYDLPAVEPSVRGLREQGVGVRRAMSYEKAEVIKWVDGKFVGEWTSESDVAFSNHPISCFLATEEGEIIGFACYDCTCKNFFGPTGVVEEKRSRGIGKALLLCCLHAMAANGYGYAIIGGVGPADFYAKAVGAVEIKGSSPGVYRDRLKKTES